MRRTAKRAVELAVVHSGLAKVLSRRQQGKRLILAYHNVVPDGERPWGEVSLHLAAGQFREHLRVITQSAEVVRLDALLERSDRGSQRPRVAITFDDGYRGAITAGASELEGLGVPATFFVTPGLCSEEGFWWDRLASASGGILADGLRDRCLTALKGMQSDVLEWAHGNGMSTSRCPEFACPATEDELEAALASDLFDVQCHTWSHPNLVRLNESERREEFGRAGEWIRERFGRSPTTLSYPYGLESPEVRRDAESAAYRWGLRVSGGWIPGGPPSPFALPRLNVPAGLSPEGLRLRLAGIGAT